MATHTNDRNGRIITTDFDDVEAARRFGELYKDDPNHWLWYWIHDYVQRRTTQTRPSHGQPREGEGQVQQGSSGQARSAIAFLGDTFVVAIGQGLKRPMIRVHFRGQRFKFYLSRRGTICLKSGGLEPIMVTDKEGFQVEAKYHCRKPNHPADCRGCQSEGSDKIGQVAYSNDPKGDEEYVGCLLGGDFLQAQVSNGMYDYDETGNRNRNRPLRPLTETEAEFLRRLWESPVSFLAECSKDMGRCCYCNQPLEDPRSKRIGYGQTCAKRWGLPWGDDAYLEKAPSFSKAWTPEASAIIATIRAKPADEAPWLAFSDWLEERGLPRCKKPERAVTMPRS